MNTNHKPGTDERWYYASGKEKLGPFSFGQLQQLALTGQLQSASMVWREGTKKWVIASAVPGLMSIPTAGPSGEKVTVGAAPHSNTSQSRSIRHRPPSQLRRALLATVIGLILVSVIGLGGYALVHQRTKPSPMTSGESPVAQKDNAGAEEHRQPLSPATHREAIPEEEADAEHPALPARGGTEPAKAPPKHGTGASALKDAQAEPKDTTSTQDLNTAKPTVKTMAIDPGQLVFSSKMGVADGLFLSISFLVIKPSEPEARELKGLAGAPFIENLTTVKDYKLTRWTQVKLLKGEKEYSLDDPQAKDVNDYVKALDYACSGMELLDFLKREGKLIVVVDGIKYEFISDLWNQHVSDLVKEVENQREKMGYKK
jgi:hypothetical protein